MISFGAHDPGGHLPLDREAGSALYDVMAQHVPALVVLVLAPVVGWLVLRRRRPGPIGAVQIMLRLLSPEHRVAAAALALSALVHAALVPTHGLSGHSALYALDAVLLGWAAHRLLHRRPLAVPLASAVLVGSLLGLALSAAGGQVPDQVAMLTKVVELVGLVALWSPAAGRAWRRVTGVLAAAAVAAAVAAPVWGAALDPAEGGHTHHGSHGGHGGGGIGLGMLMPPAGPDSLGPPTAEQEAAAADLLERTARGIARFADTAVAAQAGYDVETITGDQYHARNAAYEQDGRVLDPERPEYLIYAETPGGPVLLGAMFTAEDVGVSGPAPGGALTPWHRHEQVCFSVLPPAVAGVTSPFGACPPGTVTLARTPEMLHVWTVPGVEDPFGDLPGDGRSGGGG